MRLPGAPSISLRLTLSIVARIFRGLGAWPGIIIKKISQLFRIER